MNNRSSKKDNEIDLSELSRIIWDGKIKIILITLISFAIVFGYKQIKPPPKQTIIYQKNYLTVKPASDVEFLKFLPVINYLNKGPSLELYSADNAKKLLDLTPESILVEFIEEIMDYEELILVLQNTQSVKEKLSKLSENDQLKELYKNAKLFSIQMPSNRINKKLQNYILSLTWHDAEESSIIMSETIQLVLKNLKETIFDRIEDVYKEKERILYSKDLQRIDYLSEQSLIARELNIEENQVGEAYYLRGYKAIDNEIKIIKSRNYSELDNMKKIINDIKKTDFNWIKYNVLLMDVDDENSSKNKKINQNLPLFLSIIFGLMIGSLYVVITNKHQS